MGWRADARAALHGKALNAHGFEETAPSQTGLNDENQMQQGVA